MKKSIILLVFIIMFLTSSIASAQFAKPGSKVPLRLENYKFKTTTLLVPMDWKPSHVRYELCNPQGEVVFWKDGPIDSVTVASSGYEDIVTHYTNWNINDENGFIEIPAFAGAGQWTLRARMYDKLFGIWDYHKDTEILYEVSVAESEPWEAVYGPIYWTFDIPLLGDFAFGTPSLIYILAFIIILTIIIVNVKLMMPKKVKK